VRSCVRRVSIKKVEVLYIQSTPSATSTTQQRQKLIIASIPFSPHERKPVSHTPPSLTLPFSRRRRRATGHVGLSDYAVLEAQLLQSVAQVHSPAREEGLRKASQGLHGGFFYMTRADGAWQKRAKTITRVETYKGFAHARTSVARTLLGGAGADAVSGAGAGAGVSCESNAQSQRWFRIRENKSTGTREREYKRRRDARNARAASHLRDSPSVQGHLAILLCARGGDEWRRGACAC